MGVRSRGLKGALNDVHAPFCITGTGNLMHIYPLPSLCFCSHVSPIKDLSSDMICSVRITDCLTIFAGRNAKHAKEFDRLHSCWAPLLRRLWTASCRTRRGGLHQTLWQHLRCRHWTLAEGFETAETLPGAWRLGAAAGSDRAWAGNPNSVDWESYCPAALSTRFCDLWASRRHEWYVWHKHLPSHG